MKKGVSLGFGADGKININFSEAVEGFDSTIQNAIINIATDAGSDVFFSDKGTDLRHKLLTGGMFRNNAGHICNYAMVKTQNFINTHNIDNEVISNASLQAKPTEANNGLDLKVTATSSKGSTSKLTWPL